MLFALAALAPLPVLMWRGPDAGFLALDQWTFRLTRLANSPEATSLWTWISRDGMSPTAWAILLPLLLVLPAGWLFQRKAATPATRASLAIALGPVLVGLGFACWQLGRWNGVDAVLLALLVAVTVSFRDDQRSSSALKGWVVCLVLLLPPGLSQLWPSTKSPGNVPLNET